MSERAGRVWHLVTFAVALASLVFQLVLILQGSAVLDEWDFGPYLLWRHPELQVVAHGYGDVFTDAELARNAGLMRQAPGWREDLAELDVDAALVDPDTSLGYALMDDPGWRVVEADDAYALLEPTAQS